MIIIMTHEEKIARIWTRVCGIFKLPGFSLKAMRRLVDQEGRGVLNLKKSYNLAHANLKTRVITVDIYTPKFRKPKSINSILRILAHEIAHFQKPPFRQRFRGKWIVRQHYPTYYQQVNWNVERMKEDEVLKNFFRQ
ncbi:hypothetical protein COW86_02245 [Candidatus Kuenenbacteria bacterium CG22_combo_CG10-13_8_21_14_all_39_9]|uniref:SprT-like domain-containing protein n=5 Tax=Candidatus Kueneniibacteriota TaxID=1752740 RepID=A0A2M7MG96_9BACT|nr:MAG: hypothetical protein AUK13_02160 [Candidatus Kuenenbacteria bacterium CG2_30_39_24]PIP75702.1 MAG: hypothetical protein COW86_02245 [Candidatus Kuenenbacteria bacterium CG22_combo_CG10-13_8_21_14_all_39_9]PIX92118.1 MAG: hypothetical protein COZ26_03545 [Candidatus Kuenenbacteria bacterium CG_4_10_14_3_um_filter_39_14]